MKQNYTKGNWGYNYSSIAGNDSYFDIKAGIGIYGCTYLDGNEEAGFCLTGFIKEADARLITAAPDLLEALQAFVQAGAGPNEAMQQAKAAIAKALGNGVL